MRRTAFALACLVSTAAVAQTAPKAPAPMFNLADDAIRQIMQVARDNLHLAKLPDGGTVGVESEADKAQPLVPLASGRRIVETGLLSGVAFKCNVDWKETNFQKMMTAERAAAATPKARAYVELLHGVAMNSAQQQTKECTPTLKDRVSREIATRWK